MVPVSRLFAVLIRFRGCQLKLRGDERPTWPSALTVAGGDAINSDRRSDFLFCLLIFPQCAPLLWLQTFPLGHTLPCFFEESLRLLVSVTHTHTLKLLCFLPFCCHGGVSPNHMIFWHSGNSGKVSPSIGQMAPFSSVIFIHLCTQQPFIHFTSDSSGCICFYTEQQSLNVLCSWNWCSLASLSHVQHPVLTFFEKVSVSFQKLWGKSDSFAIYMLTLSLCQPLSFILLLDQQIIGLVDVFSVLERHQSHHTQTDNLPFDLQDLLNLCATLTWRTGASLHELRLRTKHRLV